MSERGLMKRRNASLKRCKRNLVLEAFSNASASLGLTHFTLEVRSSEREEDGPWVEM